MAEFGHNQSQRLVAQSSRSPAVVGHEPAEKWTLNVRVGGKSLQSHLLEPQTTVNGWKQFQVDLSPYAGQTVWIVVEQQAESAPIVGYWKRLDVLF